MKRLVIYGSVLVIILACAGCSSILEDETRDESQHAASQYERMPAEQIEVSGYDGLKAALLSQIAEHETSALLVVYSYDGDVEPDVERAISEMMDNDPIAIYCVASIEGTVTKIVSYFEIEIVIEYKRTKEQVESIVTVSTTRYLRTELQNVLSDYREEVVFLTPLEDTEEDIAGYVREIYYQNPRNIVVMPLMAIETFHAGADERFIELRFEYMRQADFLRQYASSLAASVRRNALAAEGENDGEILLSLVENLIGACSYDEGVARTISEHGVQNLAATAYSALVGGSAVGEGFAMAFKALCDELGFDCRVVLGYLDGMAHAWNIVSLYGEYYHIDTAMCALNGIETAFIKNDADLAGVYSWDTENTVRCNGTLTYNDIVGIDEENPEDEEDEGDEGSGDEGDEGSGDEEQGSGDEGGAARNA